MITAAGESEIDQRSSSARSVVDVEGSGRSSAQPARWRPLFSSLADVHPLRSTQRAVPTLILMVGSPLKLTSRNRPRLESPCAELIDVEPTESSYLTVLLGSRVSRLWSTLASSPSAHRRRRWPE